MSTKFTYRLNMVNGIPFTPYTDKKRMEELSDFALRPDDVFIVSFPKSGTTWMQQIVKLIRTRGVDDSVSVTASVPCLERIGRDAAKSLPPPRAFNSHTPYFMMPGGEPAKSPAKYIYVARNPKDTAVSLFYQARAVVYYEYDGDWDDFFERFMIGEVDFGVWFDHVLEWWKHRDAANILFIKYEEMKLDLRRSIERVAVFMGYELDSPTLDIITSQCTFAHMKSNPSTNFVSTGVQIYARKPGSQLHIRKGIVGDWKNHFSKEQSARMDAEYDRRLSGTGLDFQFSL